MSNDIFVLVEHRDGAVAESAYELLGRARELAAATSAAAVALVAGAGGSLLASPLRAASRAAPGGAPVSPAVERVAPAPADARIRFRRLIRPEAGGVDITKESILVSIGRGIGEAEHLEHAECGGHGRG